MPHSAPIFAPKAYQLPAESLVHGGVDAWSQFACAMLDGLDDPERIITKHPDTPEGSSVVQLALPIQYNHYNPTYWRDMEAFGACKNHLEHALKAALGHDARNMNVQLTVSAAVNTERTVWLRIASPLYGSPQELIDYLKQFRVEFQASIRAFSAENAPLSSRNVA